MTKVKEDLKDVFFPNDEEKKWRVAKNRFMDDFIYIGLTDLNNGFDVAVIKYFSLLDFEIVMDRCEEHGIGLYGIEPWPNGEYGGCEVNEMYNLETTDPKWYRACVNKFVSEGITSYFAASYHVPEKALIPYLKYITDNDIK